MGKKHKLFIVLLRVALGWLFLYKGFSAIVDPSWSIAPLIQDPLTFPEFYNTISDPLVVAYLSYAIKGLFLIIGGCLILGIGVRTVSFLGMALMLFFYFPLVQFPYVKGSYYIVNEHIIYLLLFLYMYFGRAGEYFGFGTMFKFSRY